MTTTNGTLIIIIIIFCPCGKTAHSHHLPAIPPSFLLSPPPSPTSCSFVCLSLHYC